MNTNILRLLSLLALTSCIVAAAGVVEFWRAPALVPEVRQVLAWRPDFIPNPHTGGGEVKEASYNELSARPIFSPARRPFVPPAIVVVEPPPEPAVIAPISQPAPAPETVLANIPQVAPLIDPGQFQLKGIMQSGKQISALILTPQSPEGAWVVNQSDIMGWTLARIEQNSVVLVGDGRKVILQQYNEQPVLDKSLGASDSRTNLTSSTSN